MRRPVQNDRSLRVVECARQQSQVDRCCVPSRHIYLRHRRFRRRQIDPRGRYALQGCGAPTDGCGRGPDAARPHRGPGTTRQDHRYRPVADRPHAALQPSDLYRLVCADPRLVRRAAGVPRTRLQARPLQLQREGRPLRSVPGRRRSEDRNALPARRVRHLRYMQGQAL